jgi:hypothetical protein
MPHANPHLAAVNHVADRIAKGLDETKHPTPHKLHRAVARVSVGLDSLIALHATRNPTETEGTHGKRVADAATKLSGMIASSRERLHEITREGLAEIDARIGAKVKLVPDNYAAEIRAQFRTLDSSQRVALLAELVENNNGPVLAALVQPPRILTGLTDEMRQRYTEAIISKHAPEEAAARDATMAAFSNSLTALDTAMTGAKSFTDPAKLAAIERGEAAALEAAKVFSNAVT